MYSDGSDEQLKAAQKMIAKLVKQMYYSVLLSRSLAGIQGEALNLASQHLDTIEAQYRQGIASDLAVLRQKVEVSNTAPALTQARNLYEEGLIELKNLLGLDPEAEVNLTDTLECATNGPGEITELYKAALLNRPDYRNQRLQRDLYREMITIEKAGYFPYLGAFASRQFQGQSDHGFPPDRATRSYATVAGLNLSIPLFSGGSTFSRVKQARLQADIADTALSALERRIKIEVKKAWLGMSEASERLRSQTATVETARKALEATEVRFKNGLASQLDLNDATLALNRSQTLYTQARHDVCSADAELKWAQGE
jgi:outer membrane protein TolC